MFRHVSSWYPYVIEKGRRLVNLRIVGCVIIKSTGDKTGIAVSAMKCIGG